MAVIYSTCSTEKRGSKDTWESDLVFDSWWPRPLFLTQQACWPSSHWPIFPDCTAGEVFINDHTVPDIRIWTGAVREICAVSVCIQSLVSFAATLGNWDWGERKTCTFKCSVVQLSCELKGLWNIMWLLLVYTGFCSFVLNVAFPEEYG